jgi:hypothetical protein
VKGQLPNVFLVLHLYFITLSNLIVFNNNNVPLELLLIQPSKFAEIANPLVPLALILPALLVKQAFL